MKIINKTVNGVKVWFIFLSIVFCLLIIGFLLETPKTIKTIPIVSRDGTPGLTQAKVRIDGITFNVDVADTVEERSQGLSVKNILGPREGMLFIFPENGEHPIWMKDMRFPIDIIWISENFRIVDIRKDVRPESYPEIYRSKTPARYVLEIPAGTIDIFSFNGLSYLQIDTLSR